MLSLYWHVTRSTAQRVISSWPVALSLVVYWLLLLPVGMIAAQLGPLVGGLVMYLALAACMSSYLELLSQAVSGSRFRITWDEFKRTFLVRLGDVVNVLFVFWIIGFVVDAVTVGAHARAIAAILGLAMAVFFNVIPELLYQGSTHSFGLFVDSSRFVSEHPLAWFLPNLIFAAAALGATGQLSVQHPVELLLAFSNVFSSPLAAVGLIGQLPLWMLAFGLFGFHFVMLFRGLLFRELSSGASNARMRAFRAKLRG